MTTRRDFFRLAAGAAALALVPMPVGAAAEHTSLQGIFTNGPITVTHPTRAIRQVIVQVRWLGETVWRDVPVNADGSWSLKPERPGTMEISSCAVNAPSDWVRADPPDPTRRDRISPELQSLTNTDWHIYAGPLAPKPARLPRINPNDAWRGEQYGRG